MVHSARLGLRAQIVLALSLVFLLSFWLLGFATFQIMRRNAEAERARAERLLTTALSAQLANPATRGEQALHELCEALRASARIDGFKLLRADASRFDCGHSGSGVHELATLEDGTRLSVRLPAPSDHAAQTITNLLLFYMALTGLAVALLAYLLLTHLIVRPLVRLTESAERFAYGAEQVTVSEQGSAETQRLSRTFNEMATMLRAERKRLFDRLAELEHTTAELRQTQHQLIHGEKLASVGRLAAGIAHEIGNPLAAILGLLELVRSAELDEAQSREFLGRIAGETERINDIIRDLLAFARNDPERAEAKQTADLRDVVRDAVNLVRPQKDTKDIAIDVQIDPAVRRVWGPERRLIQVVLNLLLNAVDALRGAGKIEIRALPSPDDREVVLRVLDNGPGIAPEIEPKLFEPFATTKPVGQGTGLGLAVSHAIVEALDGTIQARNREQGGACFEVRLPQVPLASARLVS